MTRKLRLERPLIAFDLETTGLSPSDDRIVEFSGVKIFTDGRRETRTQRFNPTIPIKPQASRVHGITNEAVAEEPTFADRAHELARFFSGSDLTGFNLKSFDLPMLTREFERAGVRFPDGPTRVIDSRTIFMMKEPRTLAAAFQFYCGRELDGAHSAEADATAAADVLLAQVERYPDIPLDIESLHEFCNPMHPDWLDPAGKIIWHDGAAVLSFGKHRHKPMQQLVQQEQGYLEWILSADFSAEVKEIIRNALEGKLPDPPAAG